MPKAQFDWNRVLAVLQGLDQFGPQILSLLEQLAQQLATKRTVAAGAPVKCDPCCAALCDAEFAALNTLAAICAAKCCLEQPDVPPQPAPAPESARR